MYNINMKSPFNDFDDAMALLEQSPTGKLLLEEARKNGVSIEYCDYKSPLGAKAGYFRNARVIEVSAHAVDMIVRNELDSLSPNLTALSEKDAALKGLRRMFSLRGFALYDNLFDTRPEEQVDCGLLTLQHNYEPSRSEFDLKPEHLQNLFNLYGKLPDGRNFINDMGGLEKEDVKKLCRYRPFPL